MERTPLRHRAADAWVDEPDWHLAVPDRLRQPLIDYLEGVAWCRQNGLPADVLRPEQFGLPARVHDRLREMREERKAVSAEAAGGASSDAPGSLPARSSGPGDWRDPRLGRPVATVLAGVAPEPIAWLSPGRLAGGKLTLLEGDPGLGKSTLLCEWAARVSRGEALPGGSPGVPRGVLLLSAEDGLADTIRPRLEAAGADLARVVALEEIDAAGARRPPTIPGDVPLLARLAKEIDAALIVVDPLVAFLDPALSAHRDQDVRRALAPLKDLAEATGAAILAVRHLTKTAGGRALYRGGGSIGILGAARFALLLARDPDDEERRILASQKENLARTPSALRFALKEVPGRGVAHVAWLGEAEWTARDLLAAADAAERGGFEARTALEEAVGWLRAELAAGPRPTKEVEAAAAEVGITRPTLVRARRRLGVVAMRTGVGAGSRFMLLLPEAGAAWPGSDA